MRKLFTILFATLISLGLFAQAETEAGIFLFSGSSGLDFASQSVTGMDPSDAWDDDNKESASNMDFGLLGAYFVADGLAFGLSIGYESEINNQETSSDQTINGYRYVNESSSKSTSSTMTIAPTVRYYFGESGVWLQTSYGFGSNTQKYESDYSQKDYFNGNLMNDYSNSDSNTDTNPMSILTFGAGYAISLSDNISLNPSIGYAMSSVTIEDGYTNSSGNDEDLKINMSGMTFNLSIALHLGR